MAAGRELGFYPIKYHGGAYTLAGIPDVLFLRDGRAYFVEFKRPGEKPTKLQEHRMRELEVIGCPTAVCTSAGQVREFLGRFA
jgi:hypothetical protein